MTARVFFAIGSFIGFLGVASGAFGAHALKNKLTPEMLAIFETASRYQMLHAFAVLAAAWALTQFNPGLSRAAGWFFIFGTLIFSGSLYILSLSGVKVWGAFTPIGGLLLLAGWLTLALAALRK